MPIAPGTRLGPYEIVAPLGAGGMGEVYRAKDTRLGRDVAIKVLPQHLSASPEVRARFEREAKTVSSLNHPNICTLFDVGRAPGEAGSADTDYLVMELVDGETLAQRLEKGPLPAADVLKLGSQVADALDRAHRAGVIHRDLKPGNVMLTKSGAKLMDFGLARETGLVGATGSGSMLATMTHSPTAAGPLTGEGTIIGTFQYMAPEQLEGREADARSDLWALGCVLYEMATGRRAFEGKSQASLITSIMGSQPAPISQLAPMAPPGLDRAVKQCLAKDPDDRWQTAGDLRRELAWLAEGGSQAGVPAPVAARRRSGARLAWIVATVAIVAAALLAWRVLGSRGPAREAIQTLIEAPADAKISGRHAELAMAPDGRSVAFEADNALWVRPLSADAATRLAGTEGSFRPFWSPDSRTIAYFVGGKLMRVPAAGGSPTSVCDATSGRGGCWGPHDTILLSPALSGPIMKVSASGGEPTPVTTLDSTRHELGHRFPCFLPDGDHFLFAALPGSPNGWDTYVGSLRSGTVKRLLTARSVAVYAEPGYLLFERDGRVLAQRFDPGRLEIRGAPVSIADAPERSDLDAEPVASPSQNGRLAILRSEPADTRLEIRNGAGGTTTRLDLPPAPWRVSSASPDGRRAAVFKGVSDWSRDGRNLILWGQNAQTGVDIWILPMDGDRKPVPYLRGPADEAAGKISPDGRWLAYQSNETGENEIYVQSFPEPGHKVRVSPDGGILPHWADGGKQLVYLSDSRQEFLSVPVKEGDEFLPGPPRKLGNLPPDVTGGAFLGNNAGTLVSVASNEHPRAIRLILDWTALLGR